MPAPDTEAPPRGARALVWLFLASIAACAVLKIEAWPLSGWRLFSAIRHPRVSSWQATTVDGAGRETPFPPSGLPFAFHGHVHVLRRFERLSQSRRAAVCGAWADAVRERGREARAVLIYRTERDLSVRQGDRAAPPQRTLVHRCVPKGSRAG